MLLKLSSGFFPQLLLVLISASSLLMDSIEGQRTVQFGSLRIPVKGRRGSVNQDDTRAGKSLLNTFPFNANNRNAAAQSHAHHHDDHHHGHDDHHQNHAHQHHQVSDSRAARQGAANNDVALDIGSIAAAGERCIDKVIMTEETVYDDVIECKHSYTKRCFDTYKTDYEPQQEEECDDNYRKSCFIEYKKRAFTEKVKFCFQPLVKNCDIQGPEECTTEYQSVCSTRYHEHEVEDDVVKCETIQDEKCEDVTQGYTTEQKCTKWPRQVCTNEKKTVKKYTPETECKKVPFELCGPASCPVEAGPEECQDKDETIVQDVPEEVCSLEPQRECKQVTKLVPLLKAHEECVDIPKEVCSRSKRNPRRVQKPIVKKWCYNPTKESGLDSFSGSKPQGQNAGNQPPPRAPPQAPQEQSGCLAGKPFNYCPSRANNGRCDPECDTPACGYDANECYVQPPPPPPPPTRPPQGCAAGYARSHCPSLARNGQCNPECDTAACNYDGGDCVVEEPQLGYLPPPGSAPQRNTGYRG